MPTDKRLRQKEREQAARAARAAELAAARRKRNMILAVTAIVAVFGFAFLYSVLTGGDDTEVITPGDTPGAETAEPTEPDPDAAAPPTTVDRGEPVEPECPPEDGADERRTHFTEAPPDCLDPDATYEAVFETDAGDIRVELDAENTPGTVNNFVFLSRWGYYDGTVFMRSNTSIDILQGGAPHTQDNADPGPGYTIEDEGDDWEYSPGDLVMARTGAPNSAGAQYFFSTGPGTAGLNNQGTYVVFGRVVEGLDVLESIMATHQASGVDPTEGAPSPLPIVNTVRIIQT